MQEPPSWRSQRCADGLQRTPGTVFGNSSKTTVEIREIVDCLTFLGPLRIPQVVIECLKKQKTALSPFLRSKRVTDGRKCPKSGTQKQDLLIRSGSYGPVGGMDTGASSFYDVGPHCKPRQHVRARPLGPPTHASATVPPGCARPLPWPTSRERSCWPVHAVVGRWETEAAGTVAAAA